MSTVLANAVVAKSRLERVSFFAVFAQSMSSAGVLFRFSLRLPLFSVWVSDFQPCTIGKFDWKY